MDGESAAASIVGIATAGIQVSIKVITLAGQISTAADRISSIGNDVSLMSAILHQLGDLMSEKTTDGSLPVFSKGGLETTKDSAEICQKIFKEIEIETAKASDMLRGRKRPMGEKVKLTIVEKAKWPFLQPSLEILRTDLRETKGTLMLMLQLASLALSRRVADSNTFTSPRMTEQRDIIHSILTLNRQRQNVLSESDSDVEVYEDREKRHSKTARDEKDSSYRRSTSAGLTQPPGSFAPTAGTRFATHASIEDGENQPSERPTVFTVDSRFKVPKDFSTGQVEDSPRTVAGVFTPSTINSNSQTLQDLLPETQHFRGRERATNPRGQDETKVKQLCLFIIDPLITVKRAQVNIEWQESRIRISESEIRELVTKNKADGLNSVFAAWEALHLSERPLIADYVHGFGDHVTLVSLKRTEQDLQEGNITFKGVPSFQLIVEQADLEAWKTVPRLVEPCHLKVHCHHIGPETLDAYHLPWTWDERDSDYIIIERWLPKADQQILFDHTRTLRDRKMSMPTVELRRERNDLFRVRKNCPVEERASHNRTSTSHHDQSSTDDSIFGYRAERRRKTREKSEEDEPSGNVSEDESEEDAAVNELLEKYTTFFDGALHVEEEE